MQNKTTNQPDQISKRKVSLLYNNATFSQIMLKVLLSSESHPHNQSESPVPPPEPTKPPPAHQTHTAHKKDRKHRPHPSFNCVKSPNESHHNPKETKHNPRHPHTPQTAPHNSHTIEQSILWCFLVYIFSYALHIYLVYYRQICTMD